MERSQKTILPSNLAVAVKKERRHLLYRQSVDETGLEPKLSQIQARALGNTVIPERAVTVAQIYNRRRIRRPGVVDDRHIDRPDRQIISSIRDFARRTPEIDRV